MGILRFRTSSVIAMAKTPSEKASTRAVSEAMVLYLSQAASLGCLVSPLSKGGTGTIFGAANKHKVPRLQMILRCATDHLSLGMTGLGCVLAFLPTTGEVGHPSRTQSGLSLDQTIWADNLHFDPVSDLDNLAVRFAPRRRALMRELLRSVVPVKSRGFELSFFVGVGRAVVGVQREVGVGAGIYANFRDLLLLTRAL